MIKHFLSTLAIGCALTACDSGSSVQPLGPNSKKTNNTTTISHPSVDYTLGRIMNTTLGRGINLGNSWESDGADDSGWGNPIRDTDFTVIKAAGFNSVRIPVRWQNYSDRTTHTVDPERLMGVIQDIQLAMANGLAVVVNFHHYNELNCYGGGKPPNYDPPEDNPRCQYMADKYEAEKAHFLGMWAQVATALNATFPANDMLVLEILNEPVIPNAARVNQLMTDAYTIIRTAAPGKTIMFEAYHSSKFNDLDSLKLPQDGNIIFSGHYYEPFTYTHQGHGYKCEGDLAKGNAASSDLKSYKAKALKLYPDINGIDHVPMNMGEFGVAGGDPAFCGGNPPSNEGKAEWAQKTAQAAIENGISFHYWGFGKTGGFDAYNVDAERWYPGFPNALLQ